MHLCRKHSPFYKGWRDFFLDPTAFEPRSLPQPGPMNYHLYSVFRMHVILCCLSYLITWIYVSAEVWLCKVMLIIVLLIQNSQELRTCIHLNTRYFWNPWTFRQINTFHNPGLEIGKAKGMVEGWDSVIRNTAMTIK